MPADALTIRSATPSDTDALYEICLRTADSGVDASELYSDPRLPGYIWAAPYGALEPDFAFVLDRGGKAIGYIVATPDTTVFDQRLEAEWWPQVRRNLAGFLPSRPFDANAIDMIFHPERHPSWTAPEYPAHLHINILPDAQAGGWGRRLIDTQLAALKAHGVAGVHLGVSPSNERAKGFYRHVGFTDISVPDHVLFGIRFR